MLLSTEQSLVRKNYDKGAYSFANINMLGPCNLDCFFCLGKDLPEVGVENQLRDHFSEWRGLGRYLDQCKSYGIQNIYLTGFNTDPLIYRHLEELVDYLQDQAGFCVGIRTNGVAAKNKIDIINRCRKSVSYTLLSRSPAVLEQIAGRAVIPDFDSVFRGVQIPQRVATVVTRQNKDEVLDLIEFTSRYPQIKYFQVRRVSTETRFDRLRGDILAFEELLEEVRGKGFSQSGDFEKAPIFNIYGVPVTFWRTVETSVNSINYFTNGVMSDQYFVVDGYKKSQRQ